MTAGDVVDAEVDCEVSDEIGDVDAEDVTELSTEDWTDVSGSAELVVAAGAVVGAISGVEVVVAGTLTVLTTVPLMPVWTIVAVATGWPSE